MMQLAPRFLRNLAPDKGSLTDIASRAIAWSSMDSAASLAIRLVSTLILTRLLSPEDFGLMSLAAVFLAGLALISDFGVQASVIRSERGKDPNFLRTAWTLQVLRAAFLTVLAILLAWPVSRLYGEPLLWPLITVLALPIMIGGFYSISMATVNRDLQLRVLTKMNIGAQAANTAATILAAWLTGSVWALVVGVFVGRTLQLFLSYKVLPPFRHAFRLDRDVVWEILTFGGWLLLATLMTYLGGQGVGMIYGALVDVELLGLMVIAATISMALGNLVLKLLGSVAFPALSQVYRDRPKDLRRTTGRIQKAILFGIIPVFLLLSAVSQPVIDLLYDPRYALAGTFLGIQALNAAFGTIAAPYQSAQLAMGHSRFHAFVQGAKAACTIVGILVGFSLAGPVGMLAGAGFGGLAGALVAMYFAHRNGFANLGLDAASIGVVLGAYIVVLALALDGAAPALP